LLILLICLIFLIILLVIVKQTNESFTNSNETCSKETCGALDDVNNPTYNMKEVIKNTLLIEDHLASYPQKYCKACLVKHFLINEAYLSEAKWMACSNCDKYPLLEESIELFDKVFKEWHANMDDDNIRLSTLTKIRDWRRKMIDIYYF
jgi:hypothetical protein